MLLKVLAAFWQNEKSLFNKFKYHWKEPTGASEATIQNNVYENFYY